MKFFAVLPIFIALGSCMEQKNGGDNNVREHGDGQSRRHHGGHRERIQGEGSSLQTGASEKAATSHRHHHHHRRHGERGEARHKDNSSEKPECNKEILKPVKTALRVLEEVVDPSKITADDPAATFAKISEWFKQVKSEVDREHNTVSKLSNFLSPEVKEELSAMLESGSKIVKDQNLKSIINDKKNQQSVKQIAKMFKDQLSSKMNKKA
jgi:hypothetical protein